MTADKFDMSPSDLKHIEQPDWIETHCGQPKLMLFSVVDDRSGVCYQEYRCVYGEDADSALRFLFNTTARSKGKVERPFRTVKEAHETLYHFHPPHTEQQANEWLLRYLIRYNAQPHRSENHSCLDDWQRHLPSIRCWLKRGYDALCLRRSGDLPWSQNLAIMAKVKNRDARQYYLKATQEMGWSRNVLVHQIESQAYERHHLAQKQHNFQEALPEHLAQQAEQAMQDVYMLDMLGVEKPILEAELESRMVTKIKDVMLELGYGFAFIGNQYRIVADGKEYFIDLLFSNRRLNALVAFELKIGRFKPEYVGKMNFYLNLLDDYVREAGEPPSIGIILCKERDHFEVEYALRGIEKPVGISGYSLTGKLPPALRNKLPDPKVLEKENRREMGELDTVDNDK